VAAIIFGMKEHVDVAMVVRTYIKKFVSQEMIESCMFWRKTRSSNDALAQSAKHVSTVGSTGDERAVLAGDP
jgi:hypothetical protein